MYVWIVLTARPGSGISIVPRTRAYVGFARQGASPKTQWSPRPGGVPSVPIRPSRSSPVALVVHPLRARTLQRLNAIDRRPKRRAQPCGASAAVAAVENTTRWMANLTSQLAEFQLSNGVRTGLRTSSVRRKVRSTRCSFLPRSVDIVSCLRCWLVLSFMSHRKQVATGQDLIDTKRQALCSGVTEYVVVDE
jgi:hypothetical protein